MLWELTGPARPRGDCPVDERAAPEPSASNVQRMVQAEQLAAVGELAAGLAHEIINPLDGMLECLRFLQADPQRSDLAARYYPMLEDGLCRIARVTREMMTLACARQKHRVEACSVPEVLKGLELLVAGRLKDRRVQLSCRGEATCACLCDRDVLAQVGLNLILNAADAAAANPDPQVRVSARCDSRWVDILVEDNGPGVSPSIRARLFKPFVTSKPSGKGTGLGLFVSRQLIMDAGGDLQLCRDPSSLGGAMFCIRLPTLPAGGHCHE